MRNVRRGTGASPNGKIKNPQNQNEPVIKLEVFLGKEMVMNVGTHPVRMRRLSSFKSFP